MAILICSLADMCIFVVKLERSWNFVADMELLIETTILDLFANTMSKLSLVISKTDQFVLYRITLVRFRLGSYVGRARKC